MKIDSIMVGPIMTNCYLLSDETAGVCALIDPGDEVDRVLDMVSRSGCALQYILLTHGHFDHTTAVRPILERYPDLPVYINEKDVVDGRQGDMELVFSRLPPQGPADGPGGAVQKDHQAAALQQRSVLPTQHRPAAGGQDHALPAAQVRQHPGLQSAEI